PGLPGAPGAAGGQGSLLEKAGGAALGAATGGLQQQLIQKGMSGLMSAAASAGGGGTEEAQLPMRVMQELARTARLEGTEVVDGARCHVLRADGIRDPELARLMGGEDLTLRSITLWLDADEYVSRRAVLEGEARLEGRPQPVTFELLSQDYRRVDGMYEPFRGVVRAGGMMEAITSADPEKAEEMREAMEEMEEQLARMPPEQRRMVEAQMGAALERLRQFSEGGGDFEMVTEVKELRVNAGPPTPFGTGGILAEGDASLDIAGMVVQVSPAPDASGRPAGWAIQLMGAIEGYAGGVVQLMVPGDLPATGEVSGDAGASFRWEDGRQATFRAPEGGARVTITSNDGARIAGEFHFEATGQMQTAGHAREARTLVHGRFEAPLPPAIPGVPFGGPGR
ncbi:MAG: hypothetical protein ACRELC_11795, partial [Gemmatimonadota bacterium]